jgi:hypothetical protein
VSNDNQIEIEFDALVRKTANGWWIKIEDDWEAPEVFLPESICDMGEDETFILVPEWLATEKGLI